MRFLVTGGATREPIDSIRFISNISTGRTSSDIADFFHEQGHEILFLHGHGSLIPKNPIQRISFSSFEDLNFKLRGSLKAQKFDGVIHAAAVGDFSVDGVEQDSTPLNRTSKIESGRPLKIHLKPNFKILPRLKEYQEGLFVVGFKLTASHELSVHQRAVAEIFERGGVDFVVHNDLNDLENKVLYLSSSHSLKCSSQELSSVLLKNILRRSL